MMRDVRYAVVNSDGIVINIVVWDGSDQWSPPNEMTAHLIEDAANIGIGYLFSNGAFLPPPEATRTHDEMVNDAELQKESLLSMIRNETQIWQTQLSLGIISEEDKESLTIWMKYAQAVSAIDANTAPSIDWPSQPV